MKTKEMVEFGVALVPLLLGMVLEPIAVPGPQQQATETEPIRYFSSSYESARQAFVEAAQEAGAIAESFQNPLDGPQGEPLFTDVALLGSADAKNVLVLSSATHGVEGFAGSGIQVGLLREGLLSRLGTDTSVLMIHAINPYGFAHLRRFNEDNVDLNRNFVNHSEPYPVNPGYDELSGVLAPRSLSTWSGLAFWSRLGWYLARNGMDELRVAVSGGQYSHPEGLFYGGSFEAWSNHTIRKIAARYLSDADNVVLVDLHTGLGKYGNAEIILNIPKTDEAYLRAVAIWGEGRVTSTVGGDSLSAPIEGSVKFGLPKMLPPAKVTAVSLEFGTSPVTTVVPALRAENWLHHYGGSDHAEAGRIKAELLRAFYPDADEWKVRVWDQGKEVVEQALAYMNDDGERITFTSANPFSFFHVITDLDNQQSQEVFGILRLPEGVEHKNLPLVIGVAGSLGWGEHHFEYMQMYRNMGIATFELQSFQSRDVVSTVGEQVSVTTAMMILDAYRALEKLGKDPRIDSDGVAITGWSLGGGVTLFSAWQPLRRAITADESFAAHLAFYPPCFIMPEIMEFTDAPIHILIGELDNWTPAAACEELVPLMQANGVDIDLTVYEDSHHSFDRSAQPVVDEHGYSFTDCRFKMREDGAVLMNFMDIPMTAPLLQKISFAFCTERGPTYGGNPTSRKSAFEFAEDFMKNHLLR